MQKTSALNAFSGTSANSTLIPNLIAGGALAILTVTTFYMSVRSSSHMSEIVWLPSWIGEWADHNPDSRTAVPFFLLALVYPGVIVKVPRPGTGKDNLLALLGKAPWLVAGYAGLALFLTVSECAQYFIETRVVNVDDILWGLAGLIAGAVLGVWTWQHGGRFIARLVNPAS